MGAAGRRVARAAGDAILDGDERVVGHAADPSLVLPGIFFDAFKANYDTGITLVTVFSNSSTQVRLFN